MPNTNYVSAMHSQNRPAIQAIDAVTLLKQEHRQIAEWFDQYESAHSDFPKQEMALRICRALRVHAAIEHDIFYPALLQATDDPVMFEIAMREHTDAQRMIDQITHSSPLDEMFDSKVRVLAEVIAQHVLEEECSGGIFDEAEESDMDMQSIGVQLQVRRHELEQS
ncbi:MAG: hemerythrin protein [Gammaproteobacteria bacterium]|nr:hemerythrin protein [Gammaproteobacteria bacterium]